MQPLQREFSSEWIGIRDDARTVLAAGSTGIYAKPSYERYLGLNIKRDSKIHYNCKHMSSSVSAIPESTLDSRLNAMTRNPT
jgi:hypothetical protein